ncbi:AbrB/MazE/SpoVT family DNA-binding domain-containing protein [Patescibacteria group bacterium]|nr:AbrB/MazE/SpoVT family DNA-binding domain-containing protein [Patescibacteria group bacterium]MCG2702410.1 AbrB/MazE/SpoVT family DNA-binding domain-containing protein [Candidatus Parcubacteria bacterium]MBU4210350.1 AbrB/MazE/SpoVT family DNA-binding domain-containing protein [Patescibacteria group bacterium]MBU4264540.1 AbrB/MazE/SpoVT family DNA-binding domain-containing protein [Patescibacteria group bacterium]MBU4390471.1 AbrB/MazE/SpoVT family DNA-binding domain-containing protein [Pat
MAKFRKVIKTGNSLALTIPSKIAKSFNIREGDVGRIKVNRPKARITYIFSGKAQQLSLVSK